MLRLLLGLAVTAAFTAWFVLGAQWESIGRALIEVEPLWALAAAGVLFTEFLLRAWRWKVLLSPLAPQARFGRLFVATVVGMGLNVVLPFRAGDVARPLLGQRETGVSWVPLVTVAVAERLLDVFGLVCVFLVMSGTLPTALPEGGELAANLQLYGSVIGMAGVLALLGCVMLAHREDPARRFARRLADSLPAAWGVRWMAVLDALLAGLAFTRDRRALAAAALASIAHWFNGALSIFLLFRAFDMDLPFAAACFTTVAVALTVALPQAPGFFGVFHVAIERTLVLWGQSPGPAEAFAILFWAVSFVPVTALAWWFAAREGLRWRTLVDEDAPRGALRGAGPPPRERTGKIPPRRTGAR
ncbi:MAG: hypothetical protein RLZZ299_3072 [Pseudomonadota bacterium]